MTRFLASLALPTAVILALLAACPACNTNPSSSHSAPADLAPVPDRPVHPIDLPFDRLTDLLPKAVKQAHWAVLSTRQNPQAIRLLVLTPQDLIVDLRAAPAGPDRSTVQLSVGLVEHPDLQRRFFKALDKTIAQDRKNQRP